MTLFNPTFVVDEATEEEFDEEISMNDTDEPEVITVQDSEPDTILLDSHDEEEVESQEETEVREGEDEEEEEGTLFLDFQNEEESEGAEFQGGEPAWLQSNWVPGMNEEEES